MRIRGKGVLDPVQIVKPDEDRSELGSINTFCLTDLYPERRLVVCVGLGQLPHDLHPADRPRVGFFGRGPTACSLQQHGVFTHCGFTISTSNKTPGRTVATRYNSS